MFIHCLLKANWKDGKFEGIDIPRGSFVTSLKTLSKELGMSVQEVRTALSHLVATKELTNKSANKYRVITIKNYENYQQLTKSSTINQQTTNNQNLKNGEILTRLLTRLKDEKNIEITNENELFDFLSNIVTNKQLTNKNENFTKNQQQYKTIDIEYKTINNSVCNAHAQEHFYCQLGKKFKEHSCKDCMKKYICPIPDDPTFKVIFGKGFYEYMQNLENKKIQIAMENELRNKEFSNMPSLTEEEKQELDNYDWINEDSKVR